MIKQVKVVSVRKAIERLTKRFPDIHGMRPGEEWGTGKGSIHLGDVAEGGEIDHLPAANYYAGFEDPHEKIYVLGFHRKLRDALQSMGYSLIEWYDPGTAIAYPD